MLVADALEECRTTLEASVTSVELAKLTHIGVMIRIVRRTETYGRGITQRSRRGQDWLVYNYGRAVCMLSVAAVSPLPCARVLRVVAEIVCLTLALLSA